MDIKDKGKELEMSAEGLVHHIEKMEEVVEVEVEKINTSMINFVMKCIKTILSKYEGFNRAQLEQIELGLLHGVNVNSYDKKEFDADQMKVIRIGLEDGVDVSIYAKTSLNWRQMIVIDSGLKDGLDVSLYAKPEFDELQMLEIYYGLKDGLDVSSYAKPEFLPHEMRKIRKKLVCKRRIDKDGNIRFYLD